ncbi:SMCs flexible hinge [Mucor mucedo]|uniref:SMCs flexible hinge n=1 Tax=Mucor mucedo TaxID=29922 RepID=UPI0022210BBE|nr:SMCs flexible hinge [Mucor mucedo]KAI7888400.1 SMCs flexible hinge [Mucor mucedo]
MERLNRLVVAYEYKKHEDRLNRSGVDNEGRTTKMEELKQNVKTIQNEIKKIDEEKNVLSEKMRQNSTSSSNIRELEKKIKDYSTQSVRLNTKKDLLQSSISDEQRALASLSSQRGELSRNLNEKKDVYEKVNNEYELFKKTYDEKTEEMKNTDELLQTLTTGISAEEGRENGYMEQLQQSKNAANGASTLEEQASLKMRHMRKELSEKEPQAARALAESQGSVLSLEKKKAEIVELEKKLSVLDWNPQIETDLLSRKRQEQDTINELYEKQETISRKLSSLDFQYTNPTSDFDRSKVKGLVAELIYLDKENFNASTALEICAGGKLYNVVVENEKIGAQILDKGKLRRRWTLIPLNKIQGSKISDAKLSLAESIAPGKVSMALSLVGYEEEVFGAMEWIFGGTFICEDAKTAKDVTFHKGIRTKSVTLDGDVYDPYGTLSGGSKPNSAGILIKVQELNGVRADIEHHTQLLHDLEKEIETSQKSIAEYKRYKQRLDLQSHELSLLEQRMSKSTHAQLAARVETLKEQIKQQQEVMDKAREDKEKALRESKRIESEMNEFNNNKDTKLDEMTARVERLKKELKKSVIKLKDMERAVQTFELEIGKSTECVW